MTTIVGNRDDLEIRAAEIIAQGVDKLLQKRSVVILGIPGGRSVLGVFRRLLHKRIPWKKIYLFMLDEMLVSLDHRESNFNLARDSFLDALAVNRILPLNNVHPFVVNRSKRNFGIDDCEGELIRHGGVYDIILLSSGEDGHVTSLFPYHHSIIDESKFYLILHDSPKLPPDRMSISRKLLVRSKIACCS